MFKQLVKLTLIALIVSLVLALGVEKYNSDIEILHNRINVLNEWNWTLSCKATDSQRLQYLIQKMEKTVVFVEHPGRWSGSGVIIAPSVILTAGHIVEDATELYIIAHDEKRYNVLHWERDPDNDCALLFIDPRGPLEHIAKFADSDTLIVGESVFAIGSPFGEDFFNTVTFGIISGLNRDIPFFGDVGLITSDSAINPGNSGGPVFDMRGRIIGIAVGSKWGANGFSIITASNVCRDLLEKKDDSEIEEINEPADKR